MKNEIVKNEQEKQYPKVVSGIWKFSEEITAEELIKLAEEWKEKDVDKKYIDIHVRKCSSTKYGIGFKYILCNDREDSSVNYDKFFNRMRNLLRKKFAHIPNALMGWDISSYTHIII